MSLAFDAFDLASFPLLMLLTLSPLVHGVPNEPAECLLTSTYLEHLERALEEEIGTQPILYFLRQT